MLEKIKEWLFGESEKETKQDEENEAFFETRKLSDQSGSYYINIPKEWFKKNGIDPDDIEEITMLANSDILIINPNREDEVKKKIGKKTFEVYQDEKKET